MVMSLPTDEKVLCSIPGSIVEFFSNEEFFHGMNGQSVRVFQCPLSMIGPVVFGEGSYSLLTTSQERSFNCIYDTISDPQKLK